jgi:hypothetical protein
MTDIAVYQIIGLEDIKSENVHLVPYLENEDYNAQLLPDNTNDKPIVQNDYSKMNGEVVSDHNMPLLDSNHNTSNDALSTNNVDQHQHSNDTSQLDHDRNSLYANLNDNEEDEMTQIKRPSTSKVNYLREWKKTLKFFSKQTVSRLTRFVKYIVENTELQIELDIQSNNVLFEGIHVSLKFFVNFLFNSKRLKIKKENKRELIKMKKIYKSLSKAAKKLVIKPSVNT